MLAGPASGARRRVVLLLAGCQFGGLNSLDMPGTAGHGAGSYTITVELPDVATLPQNSPVMVDDVTVGSVSGIEAVQRPDGTFFAAVKLSLDTNVNLPANSTAKVAQTSLLGSQHVELAPPVNSAASGQAGARAPTSRSADRPVPDHRGGARRRSASWSTRAISVRCKTSPMRPTPRSPAGRAPSPTCCPGWPS